MNHKLLIGGNKVLVLVLALIIASFTVVGFLSMAEMPDHGEHCPISVLMASDCVSYNHAIGMAIHHISITKSFSQGIATAAVVLLALLFFWIIRGAPNIDNSGSRVRYRFRFVKEILLFYFQKFTKWLTIVSGREYAARSWAYTKIAV